MTCNEGQDCENPCFSQKGKRIHTCVGHLAFLKDSSVSLILFFFGFCVLSVHLVAVERRASQGNSRKHSSLSMGA